MDRLNLGEMPPEIGWLPEQMLNHFREALAADPDCIVIMGHPGSGAFAAVPHSGRCVADDDSTHIRLLQP